MYRRAVISLLLKIQDIIKLNQYIVNESPIPDGTTITSSIQIENFQKIPTLVQESIKDFFTKIFF